MATRKQSTPASDAPAPETKERKPRTELPIANAEIGTFERVETANPFARGSRETLPEDHPIQKAFDASTENGAVLAVNTSTPEIVVKMLRIAASRRDRGVRINTKTEGKVIFESRPRKVRVKKKSA